MSLPTLATSDDVEAVINYLRTKPLGATLAEAKATVSQKLLDSRRLSTYETWGFIKKSGGKLLLTSLGREYSKASSTKKNEVFLNILSQENIYYVTLESIYYKKSDRMTVDEVATHWVGHFKNEVATGSERALKEQVTCFMSVASAAGLGEYVIGRRGAPTRLEINRSALEAFITKSEENDDVIEKDSDKHLSQSEDVTPINIPDEVPSPVPSTPLQRVSSNVPSLHIDIQIHIDSDATPEQIDKIFESMAKHLYNKHGN